MALSRKKVKNEKPGSLDGADILFDDKKGKIQADLSIGANVSGAMLLQSNMGISNRGFELGGAGFIVTSEQANHLGLNKKKALKNYISALFLKDCQKKQENL